MVLKDKSIHEDEFLINYSDFINNYRIYSFNLDRIIRDGNSNRYINIKCEADTENVVTVSVLLKTYSTVTMKYDQSNGITVYRNC